MEGRTTGGASPSDGSPQEELDGELVRERPRRIACAACLHPVTDRDAIIRVDGRHDHRAVNPHGYIYDIGCFSRAPGTTPVGEASTYFSWFKGYAWRIVNCRGCGTHLGWSFTREGHRFWGLVLERLIELEEDPGGPES